MKVVTSVITGSMLAAVFGAVKEFLVPTLPAPYNTYGSFVCDVALAVIPILVFYNIIPALRRLGLKV
jgi:hypothetical protein